MKDLKVLLQEISENSKEYSVNYGNINPVSVNTVVRKITVLEGDNGTKLFGEPNLDIKDLIKTTEESGSGYINIVECRELVKKPTLYASLLVWLLSSFYEKMPEVGDLAKPKAVLFLDEAHLIFSEMSKDVIKKITQIIKLIRSKGVSVFFISQSPTDIPDEILGQLGNRIQHCLRAYTPQELKAVKTAASTLRKNPDIDTEKAILELGTGEALVSFVDEEGMPSIVELAKILPPQSYMGEISKEELDSVVNNSVMETKYREAIDRESAYEQITTARNEKKEKEETEKLAKEQAKKEEEEKKLAEKKKKEEEKAMKSSFGYKLGKKVANKTVDKAINKGLNSLFKGLFK